MAIVKKMSDRNSGLRRSFCWSSPLTRLIWFSTRARFKGMVLVLVVLAGTTMVQAQQELTYDEFRKITTTSNRLLPVTSFEPLEGETGMYFVVGDRFNRVHIYHMTQGESTRVWKSRQLNGFVLETLVVDLSGDGLDDSLVARTNSGFIYVWRLADYQLIYESLAGEYRIITCFTAANMDDDPQTELVLNADTKLYTVDGLTFNRDWTSLQNYEANQIRCGDVDGDDRVEIVLNTGQVIDGRTGELEWADEVFDIFIELLDFDGDGIPEILTWGPGRPLRAFDVDYRKEIRFQ